MTNNIESRTEDRLILNDNKTDIVIYIIISVCFIILALYILLNSYYNNQDDSLLFYGKFLLYLGIFSLLFRICELNTKSYVIIDKKLRCVIIGNSVERRTIPFADIKTIKIVSDYDDDFGYFYTLFLVTNRRSELVFETSNETEIEKIADIICELSGKGIVS